MPDDGAYASPAAFRRALTDRLRNAAKESRWTLPHLQRQMAYDRLLERLYLVDEGWIVKGATALLARDIGVRATIDIDVYRGLAADIAERELREAAAKDIGDWFRFEVGPPQAVRDAAIGTRLPVEAYVGTTTWAEFRVDLVGFWSPSLRRPVARFCRWPGLSMRRSRSSDHSSIRSWMGPRRGAGTRDSNAG
jgi:hypothetical protein